MAIVSARRWFPLLAFPLVACGDDAPCDVPAARCDLGRCVRTDATKLQASGCTRREPAACSEDFTPSEQRLTPAHRASDDSCWIFVYSYLPDGFVEFDDTHVCWQRFQGAESCEE